MELHPNDSQNYARYQLLCCELAYLIENKRLLGLFSGNGISQYKQLVIKGDNINRKIVTT